MFKPVFLWYKNFKLKLRITCCCCCCFGTSQKKGAVHYRWRTSFNKKLTMQCYNVKLWKYNAILQDYNAILLPLLFRQAPRAGKKPTLKTTRMHRIAQSRMCQDWPKVIMAGGYAEGILGTTEVLNLVKRERSGGPLTTPKNYLRLATIFSEGRKMWLQLVKISKNMFITSHYFNMGVMLVLTHHDTVSGKWREIMLSTLTLLQSFQLFVSFILLSLSTWLGAV